MKHKLCFVRGRAAAAPRLQAGIRSSRCSSASIPMASPQRLLSFRRSLLPPTELPNTGSTARDVLAAERTFLAWARTGLGFVGAGSALSAAYYRQQAAASNDHQGGGRADRQEEHEIMVYRILPASALLIGNGAFLLLFATRRYTQVVAALASDVFPVNPWGTLTAVALTSVNTVTSLVLVWRAQVENEPETQDSRNHDVQVEARR